VRSLTLFCVALRGWVGRKGGSLRCVWKLGLSLETDEGASSSGEKTRSQGGGKENTSSLLRVGLSGAQGKPTVIPVLGS